MKTAKKVLIAYDGSDCANAALEDLKEAGLPPETEVLVVAVADAFPVPAGFSEESVPESIAVAVKKNWEHVSSMVKGSRKIAEEAARKIETAFPSWRVRSEAFADSPSWGIIKKAQEWKADLVVVGAHGLHSTGRLALGSLSQLVATQAPCSVRIVHAKAEEVSTPPRIVIGVDGSSFAYEALNEVASRNWKKGAAIHLVTVTDPRMKTALFSSDKELRELLEKTPEDRWAKRLIDHATNKLGSRGFAITSFNKEGDPKQVLLEEAKRWGADCIFVGARGLSGIVHCLIGSVSSSLAARAHCTVEIVRARQESVLKNENEKVGTAFS